MTPHPSYVFEVYNYKWDFALTTFTCPEIVFVKLSLIPLDISTSIWYTRALKNLSSFCTLSVFNLFIDCEFSMFDDFRSSSKSLADSAICKLSIVAMMWGLWSSMMDQEFSKPPSNFDKVEELSVSKFLPIFWIRILFCSIRNTLFIVWIRENT